MSTPNGDLEHAVRHKPSSIKRTPGLFKVEYEDDVMIGQCSKTYIVQKSRTVHTSNTMITAFKLLRRAKNSPETSNPSISCGPRINVWDAALSKVLERATTEYRLTSRRRVDSPIFIANVECWTNGVSTAPLDLELCPMPKEEAMDIIDGETPMKVDEPTRNETPMEVDLDEHDRYLVHLLETNFESDIEQ
ncbi:unnamed protein product [Mytilus coruscus]|uniref:Uncharacterized protein n=1 Tax=Mytilus coruscus TaxID=42192 RepID=A0A6J8CYF3_MYTCO|nr:unnamed protein product [Mytilus coruscus]